MIAVRSLWFMQKEFCIKYLIMQTISLSHLRNERRTLQAGTLLADKIKNIVTFPEINRIGITSALILLQVTIAGFSVVLPPMAGMPLWMMAPGIFLVFLANGFSLAQMNMKWILGGFGLSILVNTFISLYAVYLLLN